MTFKMVTLGCKVNAYESEVMREKLLSAGFIESQDKADLVVINTCSVTNMADVKSRKLIRKERRENEDSILVVCGCSAENHREELSSLGIDILIGNKDKSKIVSLVEEFIKTKKQYIKFYDTKKLEFEDMEVDCFTNQTRGYIKVQDGCNNYCSYCIIPYMRGNIRSKRLDVAIEEAKTLVKNKHKEIVLTGIHTGSYGRELGMDLSDLIYEMAKIDGLEQIRISSIEITELTDKFLNLLQTEKKICNHMHIPLQAGCDKILKAMNRKYDTKEYEKIIHKIREIRPDISITTDVIVGFPGETEEDFEATYEFCKKMEIAKIHVLPYSKRSHTVAATLPNQVEETIKKERAKRLGELSSVLEKTYNEKFIGKVVKVLMEECKEYSIGHTSNYLKVRVMDTLKPNTFYSVRIVKAENDFVLGEIERD